MHPKNAGRVLRSNRNTEAKKEMPNGDNPSRIVTREINMHINISPASFHSSLPVFLDKIALETVLACNKSHTTQNFSHTEYYHYSKACPNYLSIPEVKIKKCATSLTKNCA